MKTSTERSRKRRDRLRVELVSEVRGVVAPTAMHKWIKEMIRRAVDEYLNRQPKN